jgi:histidinol-phosphatase
MTDLDKALRLADEADAITMKVYHAVDLQVAAKPDKTPVTEGDMAVDKRLREIITQEFGDALLSEESDQTYVKGRQWILDPIDGTKNFMRGVPIWATLISIQNETGTLAAVVSAPALGRRWWAARGEGAWTKDVDGTVRQIHVSKVSKLSDAFVTYSSLFAWDEVPVGTESLLHLIKTAWRERSPGDFLGHVFVAEGAVDACVEPNTKAWDMEAHAFIIIEAGGSAWTNTAPDMPAAAPRVIITSNGLLEEQIKQALRQ